jgi:hypothetical protein
LWHGVSSWVFGERQRARDVIVSGTCACGWVPDRGFCETEVGEVVHADDVPLDRGRVPRVIVFNSSVHGCVM